jgi:hypothetical protein
MAQFNLATIPNLFKTIYPDGIEQCIIGASPFLGRVKKNTKAYKGFPGKGRELAWRIDQGGGVSADFATAQAQAGVSDIRKPYIVRKKLYVVRKLDHEALEAAEGNSGAIIDLLTEATEGATDELQKRAGSVLLGDGTGSIGQISSGSTVGSATITLADITQINNFRIGGVYNTFTAGDSVVNTGDVTITALNEDTGTLTVSSTWSAQSSGVAAGDYIVPKGDFNAVPSGVFAWNPGTAPTSGDNFYGVDRSVMVQAMSGCRYAPGQGSIDEVVIDAMALHNRQGGKHNFMLMNGDDMAGLVKQVGNVTRIQRNAVGSNGKAIGELGFEGILLDGPVGKVETFADPFMRKGRAKLTKLESWEMWSLNDPFRLLVRGALDDGMVRDAAADGSELRWGGYWNMVLRRPRDSMDITFPS